jgi:hypothetical protein
MALLISLLALLVIIAVAVSMTALMGSSYTWPLLGLAGFAVAAAILLVLRHRHAEGFLRLVAMFWSPLGPVLLLAVVLGPRDASPPEWAVPALALAFAASAASIVALYAGFAHLRQTQVP